MSAEASTTLASLAELQALERDSVIGTYARAPVQFVRGSGKFMITEFVPTEGGLSYANELAELVRGEYDFCVVGAAYPEVHVDLDRLQAGLVDVSARAAAIATVPTTTIVIQSNFLTSTPFAGCGCRRSSQIDRA